MPNANDPEHAETPEGASLDGSSSNGTAVAGGAEAEDETPLVGRVASPPRIESTSEEFHFWVRNDRIAERSQVVRAHSQFPDGQEVNFYGTIDEVQRRSRRASVHESFDGTDGNADEEAPFAPEGVTYATVTILQADPNRLTPPLEQSRVYLGDADDAAFSYGFDEMNRPLTIGRLRNGGTQFAGTAQIDLAYLLGDNGGHLNVTGIPGVGTKSSFLLVVLKSLLHQARHGTGAQQRNRPLYVVPIIFNVKGEDLMFLNRRNREYDDNREEHDEDWAALDADSKPFEDADFYAPTEPNSDAAAIDGCDARAYSWSFHDVLERGLFPYLFADDDVNARMRGLIDDLAGYFTENDETTPRSEPDPWNNEHNWPQTWDELLDWMHGWAMGDHSDNVLGSHHQGTKRAVHRRLRGALREGEAIFTRDQQTGSPLNVTNPSTAPPQVIDIHSLRRPLQRFVVAAVSKQVVEARSGRGAVRGLRYIMMLDELNRFAPRGASDPVTRLIEEVATERRSQGILLFGAQQFASDVSTKVVESAAIRAAGRTGTAELSDRVWKGWSKTARHRVSQLRRDEKLVTQPTFRAPMLVKVPFPAWAMRREDVAASAPLEDQPEI